MQINKSITRLAFLLAGACLPSLAAEAPSLFTLGPGAALAKQGAQGFMVQRRNLEFRARPDAAEAFTLDLFGETVRAERTRFVRHSESHYEWFGRLSGEENSSVLFVGHEGTIVGKVETRGKLFELKSVAPSGYVLDEVDLPALHGNLNRSGKDFHLNPAASPTLKKSAAESNATAVSAAGPVIDVMVLYNQTCINRRPDLVAFIHTLVAEANDAYARSQINQSIRLVHHQRYEGYDSATSGDLSKASTDPEILRLRRMYGADIAHILVPELDFDSSTGTAYLDEPIGLSTLAYVQSMRTFTHELGHNMGARHAREQYPNPQGYGYGYRNPSAKFYTVMAYRLDCPDCQHLNNFSNPDVWINGAPTGIANLADNARLLRENSAKVAAWMSDSYALTVEKNGQGRVKSDAAGIDCGPDCNENWNKPEIRNVTLSAVPDAGFLFKGWSGHCSGNAQCVLRMDEDRKVSALFEADPANLSVAMFDVKAKRDISPLEGTAYFRKDTLPEQVTIQAKLKSAAGSVKFEMTGPVFRSFTANGAPFTLFGNLSGQPIPWSPIPTGRFNLSVTAFSGPDGTGSNLGSKRLILDLKAPVTGTLSPIAPLAAVSSTSGGFQIVVSQAAWLDVALRSLSGRELRLRKGEFAPGAHAFDRASAPALESGIWLLRVTGAEGALYNRLIRIP